MGEILSQITRIDNNIQNALAKVAAKGVTVSADDGSDELPGLIEQISTGVDLPELDTPGSVADLRAGKQLIDGDGKVVDGAIPDVAVPTPSVSVSSAGLVTASVNQSAGYTPGGSKSGTKQLTTQAAKTVIPNKTTQTAVAAQRYTTGDVEVAPIPEEYIVPSGTKSITANGTHDVTGYASVNVEVAGSGGGGVETCTVTIIRTGNAGMKFPCIMYPIEANGYAFEDIMGVGTYTIQCMKGTFLAIEDVNIGNVSTEAGIVTGSSSCVVLYIVDDCTITVTY